MDKDKIIYISTFCVGYRDYDALDKIVRSFNEFELGIEFATWWELQPDMPERLDAVIDRFQDIRCTIHSPFAEICNEDGTEEKEYTDKLFEYAMKQYNALHGTSMVVHPNNGNFPREYGQALSIKRLLEFYEKFKKENINMTVENVGYPAHDNCLFNQEEFIKLFDILPEQIGCLIDTGHAMLNNWDIVSVIKELGPRIRGYHYNNNDGINDIHYSCFDPRGVYSEQKMIDVIEAAAKYSPNADIILEYAPGENIDASLIHSDCRKVMSIYEDTFRATGNK